MEKVIVLERSEIEPLELCNLDELFNNLVHYAGLRHDDIAMDLQFACEAFVKENPKFGAERAIRLMGIFLPFLGLMGRHNQLIMKKAKFYSDLWEKYDVVK